MGLLFIGVGRFRILGGPRGGGANSQQAHDVVMTSMRRHVPTRFLKINAKLLHFSLKSDIIENSRIEL